MATDKKVIYATGRRKTSKARVFLKPGSGQITVNGVALDKYPIVANRVTMVQPLVLTDSAKLFDLMVSVAGGGTTGQAEAIRHGISRALCAADATYRPTLKKNGFLTRDPRMVERKKYGKHKARKSTQFSKR
jgi:small subunit ribosomal protein S9